MYGQTDRFAWGNQESLEALNCIILVVTCCFLEVRNTSYLIPVPYHITLAHHLHLTISYPHTITFVRKKNGEMLRISFVTLLKFSSINHWVNLSRSSLPYIQCRRVNLKSWQESHPILDYTFQRLQYLDWGAPKNKSFLPCFFNWRNSIGQPSFLLLECWLAPKDPSDSPTVKGQPDHF